MPMKELQSQTSLLDNMYGPQLHGYFIGVWNLYCVSLNYHIFLKKIWQFPDNQHQKKE